jgi:alpha-methylacyl-CoA racemase
MQSDLREDPFIKSRDLFFDLPSPKGPIAQFRTPVTPHDSNFTLPPKSGEHTRDVFRDAGFSEADIDELIRSGAVRQGE